LVYLFPAESAKIGFAQKQDPQERLANLKSGFFCGRQAFCELESHVHSAFFARRKMTQLEGMQLFQIGFLDQPRVFLF